jgi:hypothetical protein
MIVRVAKKIDNDIKAGAPVDRIEVSHLARLIIELQQRMVGDTLPTMRR